MRRPATASLTATICLAWPAAVACACPSAAGRRRSTRQRTRPWSVGTSWCTPGRARAVRSRDARSPGRGTPGKGPGACGQHDLQARARDELLTRHPARRRATPPSSARAAQTGLHRHRRAVPHRALGKAEDRMLRQGSEHLRPGVIAHRDQRLHVQRGTQTREDRVRLDPRWPGGDELNSHPRGSRVERDGLDVRSVDRLTHPLPLRMHVARRGRQVPMTEQILDHSKVSDAREVRRPRVPQHVWCDLPLKPGAPAQIRHDRVDLINAHRRAGFSPATLTSTVGEQSAPGTRSRS